MQVNVAQKTNALGILAKRIHALLHMCDLSRAPKRRDKTMNKIRKLVDEFNALSFPWCWIGIDSERCMHLTRVTSGINIQDVRDAISHDAASYNRYIFEHQKIVNRSGGSMTGYTVDFIWDLNEDGTYTNVKDRLGRNIRVAPPQLTQKRLCNLRGSVV
jgi:hypothetical protein